MPQICGDRNPPTSKNSLSIPLIPTPAERKRALLNLLSLSICLGGPAMLMPVSYGQSTVSEYKYDDLGRLEKVETDDGTTIEYDLDDVGNREAVTTMLPAPPVASNDSVSISLYSSTLKNVVANDSDPNGDPLTITSVTQPWNGNVVIWSSTSLYITGSAVGTTSFSYTISDGHGGTDTGWVFFQVTSSGPPPP